MRYIDVADLRNLLNPGEDAGVPVSLDRGRWCDWRVPVPLCGNSRFLTYD